MSHYNSRYQSSKRTIASEILPYRLTFFEFLRDCSAIHRAKEIKLLSSLSFGRNSAAACLAM